VAEAREIWQRERVKSTRLQQRLDAGSSVILRMLEDWKAYTTIPLAWAYRVSDQQGIIDADVRRWLDIFQATEGRHGLHSLLYAFEEFRGLFYYRLSRGNATGALLARLFRHIWRPVESLSLATGDIGPGLFIAHGYATTLAAERIGANCYVHQGVTIGWDYRSDRAPIVGDDVFIGAGAVIVGAVTVGDGARIGANAMVLCDVPPGATAVGVPARIFSGAGNVVSLRREESGNP
jgi:serine O-acetyltransferase